MTCLECTARLRVRAYPEDTNASDGLPLRPTEQIGVPPFASPSPVMPEGSFAPMGRRPRRGLGLSPWQVLPVVGMGLLLLLAILATPAIPVYPMVQGPVTAGTVEMVFVGVNIAVVALLLFRRSMLRRRSRNTGAFMFVLGNIAVYLAVHFLFGVQ